MLTSSQKLHSFIQLSLTLTKLCQIDRDHLVNFYISLEKSASAIRHLGFLKLILRAVHLKDTICIIMLNFVQIFF